MLPELTRLIELFQLPFMQRAVIGGVLTGLMGGRLGSFTILRQLSFFSDALGHSALLGISLGVLLGLDPNWVLLPFAVVCALGVTYLLEKTQLWTDALLNIVYSSSLAIAVITLSFVGQYKGGLNNLHLWRYSGGSQCGFGLQQPAARGLYRLYRADFANSDTADFARAASDRPGRCGDGSSHSLYRTAGAGCGGFY